MAYSIERTNGVTLTTIEDGTVDNTTDLKLIGKNFAGYGEIQNENFLKLLENFSSANTPARPLSGQIWFDLGSNKLKFYDGTQWRTTGGSEIATTEPEGLTAGDFWWDTANEQLHAFNGTSWILVGPQDAGDNLTQMQSRLVRDTINVQHPVIVSITDDVITTIISNTEFTIDSSDPENAITGFDIVRKGITLVDTIDSTNGETSSTARFHGTATNTDKLNGFTDTDFVKSASPTFTGIANFPDTGIIVGSSNDFAITVAGTAGNEAWLTNNIGYLIKFRVLEDLGGGSSVLRTPLELTGTSVRPGTDNTIELGESSYKWEKVWATTFEGVATQADTMLVTGDTYRGASRAATNNTIAARNSTGDLYANLFVGTATRARYADLAEMYTTDQEYPTGTVVSICKHDDHEACACSMNNLSAVAGVISANPAYLMNEGLVGGQAVALKGRVPVRIVSPVKKGQAVYAWNDGTASTIPTTHLVGIALESNNSEEEKLVECFLKV